MYAFLLVGTHGNFKPMRTVHALKKRYASISHSNVYPDKKSRFIIYKDTKIVRVDERLKVIVHDCKRLPIRCELVHKVYL